jgi:hypothetical protein
MINDMITPHGKGYASFPQPAINKNKVSETTAFLGKTLVDKNTDMLNEKQMNERNNEVPSMHP